MLLTVGSLCHVLQKVILCDEDYMFSAPNKGVEPPLEPKENQEKGMPTKICFFGYLELFH